MKFEYWASLQTWNWSSRGTCQARFGHPEFPCSCPSNSRYPLAARHSHRMTWKTATQQARKKSKSRHSGHQTAGGAISISPSWIVNFQASYNSMTPDREVNNQTSTNCCLKTEFNRRFLQSPHSPPGAHPLSHAFRIDRPASTDALHSPSIGGPVCQTCDPTIEIRTTPIQW